MANMEEYIFRVDAEVSKAVSKLNQIRQLMDGIDKINKKGIDNYSTTSQKDMDKNMRSMKKITQEYRLLEGEIERLKNQYKDLADKADLPNGNTKEVQRDMTRLRGSIQAYTNDVARLKEEYKETLSTFRELSSFQQNYSKNFKHVFSSNDTFNLPTDDFERAKNIIKAMANEADGVSSKLDEVVGKMREVNKLDRRSESLSRRASSSKYMSHQQASNFRKDLNTVNGDFTRERDDNINALTKIGMERSRLMSQIKSIEENPEASSRDIDKKIALQQTVEAMDKEREKRMELNSALERTIANMERYNNAVQDVTVKPDRNTARGMAYERAPAIGLAITGAVFGAVGGLYHQGASVNKGMRQDEMSIGQRIGMDGSQWRKSIRDGALNAGLNNKLGMTGQEMLAFQNNYLSERGYSGREDLDTAMKNQATFSRVTGVNTEDTKSFFNSVYKSGNVNGRQTKDIQNAFVGAIKKSGMEGREKDQLKALEGILGGMSENRNLTNKDIMNTLGLQSILAQSGNRSLQGEKGGQLMSNLDQGIRNGFNDPQTRILFGQGTKYQGLEGRWELRKQMEKGISDVDNVKRIAQASSGVGGSNEKQNEAFASIVQGRLGVNISSQQAEGLMDLFRSGKLDQKSLDKALKDNSSIGDKMSKDKMEEYKKSSASTDNQSDATTQKQAAGLYDMGEVVREANNALGGIPAPAYAAVVALGALAMAAGAAALSFGISKGIRTVTTSTFGKGGTPPVPVPPVGGGGAPRGGGGGGTVIPFPGGGKAGGGTGGGPTPPTPPPSGGGSWGSKFLGGAGKVLGGIGTLFTLKWASDLGDSLGDNIFGHKKGTPKMPGLFENPFKNEKWEDDKEGWIEKGVGSMFGSKKVEAAELTPEEVKANEEKAKLKESGASNAPKVVDPNSTKEQVDKETTNTKQRTETKKTDNLAYERENLTYYEKILQKAERILAQARTQNGIFGNSNGSGVTSGGGMGVGGNGGKLQILPQGQKWQNASNLQQSDLGYTEGTLTAADLDNWINSKAPEGSLMRGMGATFLKAGQQYGLDPRYLVAHAAEESGWGTSNIAKSKGNFFGIGAFDASPGESAFTFKDGGGSLAENGIMGGAKWIADHYYAKGNTTLDKMHQAGYATNSDWASNIAGIMKGAPSGTGSVTATVNVNVAGDESVGDKIKNKKEMQKVGDLFTQKIYGAMNYYSKEMKAY